MKYPNLTAEYEASKDTSCDLRSLAFFANVTDELLTDIIYGDEDVSQSESKSLYSGFGWYHNANDGLTNYSMSYLFAPSLATLNPCKPKTRILFYLLRDKLTRAIAYNPAPVSWLYSRILAKAKLLYARMDAGERVTYAEYRSVVCGLGAFIAVYSKPKPRGRRIAVNEQRSVLECR